MPFSFATIPENKKDYIYGNQFVSLTLYLKLIDDFKEACSSVAKTLNKLKKST